MSPKELLEGTSPQVRDVINQILKIEKQYKHIENMASNKAAEAQIADAILKLIHQEIAQ
jgi:Ni,Fe-hydrogenase I small subunit